jgi:hypothetical protein
MVHSSVKKVMTFNLADLCNAFKLSFDFALNLKQFVQKIHGNSMQKYKNSNMEPGQTAWMSRLACLCTGDNGLSVWFQQVKG